MTGSPPYWVTKSRIRAGISFGCMYCPSTDPAVARHPAERMSSVKVLFALGFLLESLGLDVGFTRLALTFLYQWVSRVILREPAYRPRRLPNSRKSESEADQIGLRLMSYVWQ